MEISLKVPLYMLLPPTRPSNNVPPAMTHQDIEPRNLHVPYTRVQPAWGYYFLRSLIQRPP